MQPITTTAAMRSTSMLLFMLLLIARSNGTDASNATTATPDTISSSSVSMSVASTAQQQAAADNESSCSTPDEDRLIAAIATYATPVAFGLIGITGLFGNALVVLVVLSNAQMRSTTNVLILNLAISDLLFVVCCVPFTATDYVAPVWPFGDVWCRTVQYLIVVTVNASIFTLVLMSLDRYLAVVHPIASRPWRNERNTVRACALLWLVVLGASLPAWYAHGVVRYTYEDKQHAACKFLDPDRAPFFHIALFCSSYLLPLCLISGLYVRMLSRLWRTVVGGNMSAESHRGRKRVTRLVVIVVAAFAVCWFPIQMILVLKSLGVFEICSYVGIILQIVAHIFAYCSACINPLLYAFLSDNFRKAFRKVVNCGPRHGDYRRTSHMQPVPTKSTRTVSLCPDVI